MCMCDCVCRFEWACVCVWECVCACMCVSSVCVWECMWTCVYCFLEHEKHQWVHWGVWLPSSATLSTIITWLTPWGMGGWPGTTGHSSVTGPERDRETERTRRPDDKETDNYGIRTPFQGRNETESEETIKQWGQVSRKIIKQRCTRKTWFISRTLHRESTVALGLIS